MPLGRTIRLLDELRALGITELSISGGGEPTLAAELPSLLDAALERGLRVRLITNGTHVSPATASRLPRLHEVRISLDAATAGTWARLRQVPEAWFPRVLETIELCAGRGPQVGVTFVVNELNAHEVVPFVNLITPLRVDAIVLKHDVDATRRLPRERYEAAVAPLAEHGDPRLDVRPWIDPSPRGRPCSAASFKVAFDAAGVLYSCCLASQPRSTDGLAFGPLGDDGFEALWRTSRPLRDQLRTGTSCANCNVTDAQLNRLLHP